MKARSFPRLDRKATAPPYSGRDARDRISNSASDGCVPTEQGRRYRSRDKRGLAIHGAVAPDKATWVAWRMKLGASHKQALKLWDQYQEWLAEEAHNGPVRRLTVLPWQNWEREFRAFLDEMPRKPFAFLAMVAAAEKKRAALAAVNTRKAKSHERYRKQYARRAYS